VTLFACCVVAANDTAERICHSNSRAAIMPLQLLNGAGSSNGSSSSAAREEMRALTSALEEVLLR